MSLWACSNEVEPDKWNSLARKRAIANDWHNSVLVPSSLVISNTGICPNGVVGLIAGHSENWILWSTKSCPAILNSTREI